MYHDNADVVRKLLNPIHVLCLLTPYPQAVTLILYPNWLSRNDIRKLKLVTILDKEGVEKMFDEIKRFATAVAPLLQCSRWEDVPVVSNSGLSSYSPH
jgi:hypothetical protein